MSEWLALLCSKSGKTIYVMGQDRKSCLEMWKAPLEKPELGSQREKIEQ